MVFLLKSLVGVTILGSEVDLNLNEEIKWLAPTSMDILQSFCAYEKKV